MKKLDLIPNGHDGSISLQQRNEFYVNCYTLLHNRVFAIAYDFTRNALDADDLTASFFEKLLRLPIDTFLNRKNLKGYILTAAYNHCRDYVRVQRKTFTALECLDKENTVPSIERKIELKEKLAIVQRLIDDLPNIQQRIIRLVAQGYSHKEIASKLGITETNSTSRLSVARKTLRKSLEESEDGEDFHLYY
jgi:RNA polymerase sigma-70 factor (ECF subfamily)